MNSLGRVKPSDSAFRCTVGLTLALAAVMGTLSSSEAQSVNRIACTQAALTAAISQASAQGGGTVVFSCSNTTIPLTVKIGTFQNNVILDGETRNITLEYTADFSGCTTGDNGIGPETADMNGSGSAIRNLRFTNWLESIQIQGPNNIVEGNTFIGHNCSDDAISTNQVQALNTVIRNNVMQGYEDKAIQMSYGSGLLEGNTFIDSAQPIRSPYDNSAGGVFIIRGNTMRTSGNINECNGVHIDGTYQLVFENNTHTCLRGVRLGGSTQVIFRNNTITGNPRGGLLLRQNARASLSGNTITGNGTSAGTEPAGGVIVWESAVADLGGGTLSINGQTVSSAGNNTLRGNGVADLRNLNTGITVKAEGNCWDHTTVSEVVSLDTAGGVEVDPPLSSCTGGGTPPPSAPMNLRLVS